jgi:hypothetical protein
MQERVRKVMPTDRSIDRQGQVDTGKSAQLVAKRQGGPREENEHGVNAGCAELAHAVVVVLSCVDRIDTNGVGGKLLEVGDVALARGGICKATWGQRESRGVLGTPTGPVGGSESERRKGGSLAHTTKLMGSGKPPSTAGPRVPAF